MFYGVRRQPPRLVESGGVAERRNLSETLVEWFAKIPAPKPLRLE